MARDLLAEQPGVDRRVARQEGRAEAGGERRLGLAAEAALGAGEPRRIARQEVVHRLFRGEPADRRQHAEGIRRQHHDVGRVPAHPRHVDIAEKMQRVGGAGVFGQRAVVEIGYPGVGVDDHVFQQRAEAEAGVVDLGLGLGREVDRLGVAPALEIEHAVIGPAMLVVADQNAGGIGRERRLAGPREAEEDCRVAAGPDIGRAVHRQHALAGQDVVEHREDGLLDLAGVVRSGHQDRPLGEVEQHADLGAGAVDLRHRVQIGCVQDGEFRFEIRALRVIRRDEHVAREQAVPGLLGHHPDRQAVLRIGAGIDVLDEQLAVLQIGGHPLVGGIEMGFRDPVVDRPPPDIGRRGGLVDDELVLRRAPGVLPGLGDEAAAGRQHALAPSQPVLVERRHCRVPVHGAGIDEPVVLQTP